jgi:4-hydroxybenzoate polyprenyltransferase
MSAVPARGLAQLRELLEMIKFQHALFALPFAFTGMLAAARGLPDLRTLLLIVACMVTARTAAMTWNRIADRKFDALNPRTSERALPAGRVGLAGAWALLLVSAALFVLAAGALNRTTLLLSPVALLVTLGYSWTKRFTWATHFVLGLALAIAPIGAWLAVRGTFSLEILVLGLAVLLWTSGFDLLYSCQDADFDREQGLRSLPARFGVPAALATARVLHAVAFLALLGFCWAASLGIAAFSSVAVAGIVMAWSHSLVRADDLSRVGLAFFQANVTVSVLVLAGTAWDCLL